MQFGEAIEAAEGERLLSRAYELGVVSLDTAEMYPVPPRAETQGRSEVAIGRWLRGRRREDVMITTKVSGPSGQMPYIRDGCAALDGRNIAEAINTSLQRLCTDYIDLILLHWPDRYIPMFGESEFDIRRDYSSAPIEEQLLAIGQAVDAGKIGKHLIEHMFFTYGSTKGLCGPARSAKLPKVKTLQNAYSLVCRTFDMSLAECCHREGVGLMAYSPLAMGLLTGKYNRPGSLTSGARLVKYRGRYAEAESRYGPKPNLREAVAAYCAVAEKHGMAPSEMAIRFVVGRPLVKSTVLGVTSVQQLEELHTAAWRGPLEPDVLEEIDHVHLRYPNPAP